MFAGLTGIVKYRTPRYALIQGLNDAFAYEVRVPLDDPCRPGDSVHFWIVQGRGTKDNIALIGVRSVEERNLIAALLHVKGIGIAKALEAARARPREEIISRIEAKDVEWVAANIPHMATERAKLCVATLWRRIREMTTGLYREPSRIQIDGDSFTRTTERDLGKDAWWWRRERDGAMALIGEGIESELVLPFAILEVRDQ